MGNGKKFVQILILPDYVIDLIKSRKIDRIDTAYRLSKLVKNEQKLKSVVNQLIGLSTHDFRDVVSTFNENPEMSVDTAEKTILKLKPRNLHFFVIDFDEKDYQKLVSMAKSNMNSPAELLKQIVEQWLSNVDGEDATA